ncbi:MAG: SCP2 sterol-binding domain-containing protein [Roseiflexaceae bacterium]|nr:SCP2 sterol-binding domain-containing protein [Roseiflexaceae bacterium]
MPVFRSAEELYVCFGRLYDDAMCDPKIAPKIKDSRLVIQFCYHQPDAVVTIDATSEGRVPGAFFDVYWGDRERIKPDIEMTMSADTAHQFWQGKVNLMAALTRKQIVARGPIPKILKLLPAVAPMYEMYPRILHEVGRDDLILR